MATTADYVSRVSAQLTDRIRQHTDALIASDAIRHDKLAGTIHGLTTALDVVRSEARRFHADVEEDAD